MSKGIVTWVGAALIAALAAEASATEWNVSLWGKRRAFTEHVERLADLVFIKTAGEFKIKISYGRLAKARENLDGIAAGDFEMAQICAGYHPGKTPSLTVLELPFLGVTTLDQEIALSQAVYEHPATQADLARWNATLLMPSPLPQYNIIGTGIPPTSLQDFIGLTVRATGGVGKAVEALGATLVPIPAADVQAALKNEVVRAVTFARQPPLRLRLSITSRITMRPRWMRGSRRWKTTVLPNCGSEKTSWMPSGTLWLSLQPQPGLTRTQAGVCQRKSFMIW